MRRLLKYMKPYRMMVFFSIVLLFAQANCDLALPDYLSKIVNVGIQQGGIETAVPIGIRESEMDRVCIFLEEENETRVLDAYTLIDSNSDDYEPYLEVFPALENEAVYVLNDIEQEEIDALSPIMARPLLIVYSIERMMENPPEDMDPSSDFAQLMAMKPPTMDIFTFLSLMPEEQLQQVVGAINEQFADYSDSMIVQAAIEAIKAEYDALGVDIEKLQRDYTLRVGGIMLLLTVLSMLCTIAVGYLSAKVAGGMARDIRHDTFEKVESFSNAEFDSFSTASLITRSTNDITQIQMVVVMIVRMVFYAPIMGIGGIIRALGKATSMWWIIAVAVLVIIGIIMVVFSIALPKFKSIQSLIDRLNLVSRENISGLMVVRAFNKQAFEENRFDKANQDLTTTSLFINRLMVIMMPLMMLIMNIITIAIIWVGAHEVADGFMQVGDMMAFMQYAMQIVMSFLMLSIMFIIIPRASVSADRIADVLDTEPSIHDPADPKEFPIGFKGEIEFRNVSFRYPGAESDALENITFVAKPGQTTAIIGSTGSGKSTLVNLIPRFYDVTAGAILVDNMDIRQVTQHNLREKIGYVPQQSALFSGSIKSNMLYADENTTEENIHSAIDIAQATEFVYSKAEGTDAKIAQGGMNVSGGQKQRLSIARALVKRPPIYVFDDCVSALDFKTDAALRKALKEHTGGSTIILVSQRVATIMNAEQIIVLDEGKIVGLGKPKDLLETCKPYKEIAVSQLNLEELK